MTQIKRNEIVLGKMMRSKGYYVQKFGDVRYARCPHCEKMFMLPKGEKKPDFLIATQYRFVEAKGAGNSWHFADDFRPNQREFMNDPKNMDISYIFVEIGEGNAPKGKRAFLIPWKDWLQIEEQLLVTTKSILFEKTDRSRSPALDDIPALFYYEVVWENGKWTIPQLHVWNIGLSN